jgi:cytochrome P450
MKSQFTRKHIDDNLAASERHLQDMLLAIGKTDYNGWTPTTDLMDVFFRFAMDSSTEFMFGISANTQMCALVREGKAKSTSTTISMDGFEDAFKRVQKIVGVRMKMGKSYWMIDGWEYRKACHDLVAIKNPFIAAAIDLAKKRLSESGGQATNVIEALVADGHDFDYIANQCRHLIIAGFETTSALLGFSFALIERHPEVFNKLRDAVIAEFGTEGMPREPINFETLKNCKYLQWVIFETLRLYPAGPSIQRVAVRDTVLPRGGGPDGTLPTAVPKGSTVQLGIYLSHRRKDIWGEDAAEFRPERWEGRKKGYDFIPFIAGPQICLGQQYSMTQAAYVIARFLMRFDAMEKPIGQDNLRKGWQTVLSPGNGVKMRMRLGADKRALNLLSFPY